MKTIYFIRHAKSNGFKEGESDFERTVSKKGYKQIKTISSYLRFQNISPDIVLSSYAMRAQETSVALIEALDCDTKIQYFQQLYFASIKEIVQIMSIQDDDANSMFVIAHHPHLVELVNGLSKDHISKIPSMGVVCLKFDIDEWKDISTCKGSIDFFISPKQFKYYMPRQIRTTLRNI